MLMFNVQCSTSTGATHPIEPVVDEYISGVAFGVCVPANDPNGHPEAAAVQKGQVAALEHLGGACCNHTHVTLTLTLGMTTSHSQLRVSTLLDT
jgi:hypothetical protein